MSDFDYSKLNLPKADAATATGDPQDNGGMTAPPEAPPEKSSFDYSKLKMPVSDRPVAAPADEPTASIPAPLDRMTQDAIAQKQAEARRVAQARKEADLIAPLEGGPAEIAARWKAADEQRAAEPPAMSQATQAQREAPALPMGSPATRKPGWGEVLGQDVISQFTQGLLWPAKPDVTGAEYRRTQSESPTLAQNVTQQAAFFGGMIASPFNKILGIPTEVVSRSSPAFARLAEVGSRSFKGLPAKEIAKTIGARVATGLDVPAFLGIEAAERAGQGEPQMTPAQMAESAAFMHGTGIAIHGAGAALESIARHFGQGSSSLVDPQTIGQETALRAKEIIREKPDLKGALKDWFTGSNANSTTQQRHDFEKALFARIEQGRAQQLVGALGKMQPDLVRELATRDASRADLSKTFNIQDGTALSRQSMRDALIDAAKTWDALNPREKALKAPVQALPAGTPPTDLHTGQPARPQSQGPTDLHTMKPILSQDHASRVENIRQSGPVGDALAGQIEREHDPTKRAAMIQSAENAISGAVGSAQGAAPVATGATQAGGLAQSPMQGLGTQPAAPLEAAAAAERPSGMASQPVEPPQKPAKRTPEERAARAAARKEKIREEIRARGFVPVDDELIGQPFIEGSSHNVISSAPNDSLNINTIVGVLKPGENTPDGRFFHSADIEIQGPSDKKLARISDKIIAGEALSADEQITAKAFDLADNPRSVKRPKDANRAAMIQSAENAISGAVGSAQGAAPVATGATQAGGLAQSPMQGLGTQPAAPLEAAAAAERPSGMASQPVEPTAVLQNPTPAVGLPPPAGVPVRAEQGAGHALAVEGAAAVGTQPRRNEGDGRPEGGSGMGRGDQGKAAAGTSAKEEKPLSSFRTDHIFTAVERAAASASARKEMGLDKLPTLEIKDANRASGRPKDGVRMQTAEPALLQSWKSAGYGPGVTVYGVNAEGELIVKPDGDHRCMTMEPYYNDESAIRARAWQGRGVLKPRLTAEVAPARQEGKAEVIPAPKEAAKEPHEMTRAEFAENRRAAIISDLKASVKEKPNDVLAAALKEAQGWSGEEGVNMNAHRNLVKHAHDAGNDKTIPDAVKAEYPDLFPERAKPVTKPGGQEVAPEKAPAELKRQQIAFQKIAEKGENVGKITIGGKVYQVKAIDGAEVRKNVDTDFTEGGHGLRYPYMKRWADADALPENADKTRVVYVEKVTAPKDLEANALHEVLEHEVMARDSKLSYDDAHYKTAPPAEKEPVAVETKPPPEKSDIESGDELSYNRRNRVARRTWADFADMNPALKAREIAKNNIWPQPDYAKMITDGEQPVLAHLAKQVRDAISAKPSTQGVPTDETFRLYVEGVRRVDAGLTAWMADREAISQLVGREARAMGAQLGKPTTLSDLAYRGPSKSLLDYVYPDGWKAHRDEVIALGGNRLLQRLQPGYDEFRRAMKEVSAGWPAKQESWQKQGYAAQAVDAKIETPESSGGERYYIKLNGHYHQSYDTLAEAEAAKAALKPYGLFRKNRLVETYNTLDESVNAARAAVQRTHERGGDIEGTDVSQAERIGAERRLEGQDVDADALRNVFGFRGVNFGNWMKGPSAHAEAQAHLNHVHDALLDLAEVIGVPPKALSLDGMLGLAVGAQGSGKNAAHFVPGVNEINLTRTHGAGALSHEWAHGLDHYFGSQGGLAASRSPYLSEHAKPGVSGVRSEVTGAFRTIVDRMTQKPISEERLREMADERAKSSAKNVEGFLRAIRGNDFSGSEQEAKFDALAERVRKGDYGEGKIAAGQSSRFSRNGRATTVSLSPVLSEMRDLARQHTGRLPPLENYRGLQTWMDVAAYEKSHADAIDVHQPQTMRTTYLSSALAMDAKKKGKLYWSTPREMFARALDAYVSDKLQERAAKNTYLAGLEIEPPIGEERKAINGAFDKLFSTIKTRETDKGVALYRPASEVAASLKGLDGIKAEMQMRSMARQWIGPAADHVQIVKQIVDAYGQQMAGVYRGPGLTEIAEAYRGDPDTWRHELGGHYGVNVLATPKEREVMLSDRPRGAAGEKWDKMNEGERLEWIAEGINRFAKWRNWEKEQPRSWALRTRVVMAGIGQRIKNIFGKGDEPITGIKDFYEKFLSGELRNRPPQEGEGLPETYRPQTDTPEFQKWFGESKVVDERGKPLVVYHASPERFNVFDTSKEGAHFGTLGQATALNKPGKKEPRPFFLSIKNPVRMDDIGQWNNFNGLHAELSRKNIITDAQSEETWAAWQRSDTEGWKALKAAVEANGHDGIVYSNAEEVRPDIDGLTPGESEFPDSYIAFHPNQIKSASENRGTFSPKNKDVRYRPVPADAQPPGEPPKPPEAAGGASDDELREARNAGVRAGTHQARARDKATFEKRYPPPPDAPKTTAGKLSRAEKAGGMKTSKAILDGATAHFSKTVGGVPEGTADLPKTIKGLIGQAYDVGLRHGKHEAAPSVADAALRHNLAKLKVTSREDRQTTMRQNLTALDAAAQAIKDDPDNGWRQAQSLMHRTYGLPDTIALLNASGRKWDKAVDLMREKTSNEMNGMMAEDILRAYQSRDNRRNSLSTIEGADEEGKPIPSARDRFDDLMREFDVAPHLDLLINQIERIGLFDKLAEAGKVTPKQQDEQQSLLDGARKGLRGFLSALPTESLQEFHDRLMGVFAQSRNDKFMLASDRKETREAVNEKLREEFGRTEPATIGHPERRPGLLHGNDWIGASTNDNLHTLVDQMTGGLDRKESAAADVLVGRVTRSEGVANLAVHNDNWAFWSKAHELLVNGQPLPEYKPWQIGRTIHAGKARVDTALNTLAGKPFGVELGGKTLQINKSELMNLWNKIKDPENVAEFDRGAGLNTVRRTGHPDEAAHFESGDEAVKQIKEVCQRHLTPKERELADWIFAENNRPELRAQLNGMSRMQSGMDKFNNPNWSGRVRDRLTSATPPSIEDLTKMGAGAIKNPNISNPGWGKERKSNLLDILVENEIARHLDHVDDRARYIHMTPAITDAVTAVRANYGDIVDRIGIPGLQDMLHVYYRAARLERLPGEFLGGLRRNVAVATLWYRMSSLLKDRIGITAVTPFWLASNVGEKAAMGFATDPRLAMPSKTFWAAPSMRRAFDTLTRESGFFKQRWIGDPTSVFASRYGAGDAEMKNNASVWFHALQQPGMAAHAEAEAKPALVAFSRMMESGMPLADAVAATEDMTRSMQPPSSPVDETRIYRKTRDNALAWAFLPFLGPRTALANWARRSAIGWKGAKTGPERAAAGKRLALAAGAILANAAVAAGVTYGLHRLRQGFKEDEKEAKQWTGRVVAALGELIGTAQPAAGVPVKMLAEYMQGYPASSPDILTSLIPKIEQGAARVFKDIERGRFDWDDPATKRRVANLAEAVGQVTGVPGVGAGIDDAKLAAGATKAVEGSREPDQEPTP